MSPQDQMYPKQGINYDDVDVRINTLKANLPSDPLTLRLNSGLTVFPDEVVVHLPNEPNPGQKSSAWQYLFNCCSGLGVSSAVINARPPEEGWEFSPSSVGIQSILDHGSTVLMNYSGANRVLQWGQYGQLYDRYMVEYLVFEYIPSCSRMTDGQVTMLWNDNPMDPIPSTQGQFLQNTRCITTQVYNKARLVVRPRRWLWTSPQVGGAGVKSLSVMQTRGSVAPYTDRTVDCGWFAVIGRGSEDKLGVAGTVRVHYAFRFAKPSINLSMIRVGPDNRLLVAPEMIQAAMPGEARTINDFLLSGVGDGGDEQAPAAFGLERAVPKVAFGQAGSLVAGGGGNSFTVDDRWGSNHIGNPMYYYDQIAPAYDDDEDDNGTSPSQPQKGVATVTTAQANAKVITSSGQQSFVPIVASANPPQVITGTGSPWSNQETSGLRMMSLTDGGEYKAATLGSRVIDNGMTMNPLIPAPGQGAVAYSVDPLNQPKMVTQQTLSQAFYAQQSGSYQGARTAHQLILTAPAGSSGLQQFMYSYFSDGDVNAAAPAANPWRQTLVVMPTNYAVTSQAGSMTGPDGGLQNGQGSIALRHAIGTQGNQFVIGTGTGATTNVLIGYFAATPAAYVMTGPQVRGQARLWGLIRLIVKIVMAVVRAVVNLVKTIKSHISSHKQGKALDDGTAVFYAMLGMSSVSDTEVASPFEAYANNDAQRLEVMSGTVNVPRTLGGMQNGSLQAREVTFEQRADVSASAIPADPRNVVVGTTSHIDPADASDLSTITEGGYGSGNPMAQYATCTYQVQSAGYALYDATAAKLAGDPPLEVLLAEFSPIVYQGRLYGP